VTCFICATCGAQFAERASPPERCPICEDDRQYVGLEGQRWMTPEELRDERRNEVRQDAGYLGVESSPRSRSASGSSSPRRRRGT